MEREWTGNTRRMSHADRSRIERLIWSGETFAMAAAPWAARRSDPALSRGYGRAEAPG